MPQGENSMQIKNIISKNKKIVIPTAIILVLLLLLVGIYFILQNNNKTKEKISVNNTATESQTEEKINISQDDAQSDNISAETPAEQSSDNSSDTSSNYTPVSSNESSTQSKNNPPSGKPSTSAHTHQWNDHITTKQVWVPNIVEIPVYETNIVYGAQFYTFSGIDEHGHEEWIANGPIYWFENGFTHDDLSKIIFDALEKSPNGDGIVDGVSYGSYANIQRTDRVQTGTKQEDHGSYKTEFYVDYQYCNCGARK